MKWPACWISVRRSSGSSAIFRSCVDYGRCARPGNPPRRRDSMPPRCRRAARKRRRVRTSTAKSGSTACRSTACSTRSGRSGARPARRWGKSACQPARWRRRPTPPAFLDACSRVLAAAIDPDALASGDLYLPSSIGAVRVHQPPSSTDAWSHATLRKPVGQGTLEGDIRVHDLAGRLLIEIDGLRLQQVRAGAPPSGTTSPRCFINASGDRRTSTRQPAARCRASG